MASDMIAPLHDRGVVSVTGTDAGKLLQGLITNDMDALSRDGAAIHAGLLSPQGKILFEFFVVRTADGFLIELAKDKAADFVKRLTMYRLRADVALHDVSANYKVYALWGATAASSGETRATVSFADPRIPALGRRILADAALATDVASATNDTDASEAAYDAHRIALGVPEGGKDYDFGDAYPHEADFDLFNGVSFKKGCYVGQEVVSRMQNKTVVRKRIVKVSGAAALTMHADILLGEAAIGRVGSVDGVNGLAMLRLDRAVEAREKGLSLTANGVAISPDEAALETYRVSVASRPATPGLV